MRVVLILIALAFAVGCGGRDLGLAATLQIAGALYVEGAPPAPSGGPEVLSLETTRNEVRPGERGHVLRGTLPRDANGVAIFAQSDRGYWIVPAGPPDAASPDLLALDLRADVAHAAPLGPLVVEARATDREGRTGAARALTLEVRAAVDDDDAELAVTLTWDGAADLDLRVVDPSGVEIGARNPNAWMMPPPEQEPDPDGWRAGATLEVDAQAGCTLAATPTERVRWPVAPAAGPYLVRVDTPDLCGSAVAWWRVRATRRGQVVAEASGVSTPSDARFGHDAGAGVLALRFEVP